MSETMVKTYLIHTLLNGIGAEFVIEAEDNVEAVKRLLDQYQDGERVVVDDVRLATAADIWRRSH